MCQSFLRWKNRYFKRKLYTRKKTSWLKYRHIHNQIQLEMFLARKPCVVSFRSNAFPWKWALMMSICVSNKIHLFFTFFFVLKLSIFHNFPMPDKFSTKFVCLLLQKWNLAKEQQQQHKLSNINLRKLLIY